MKFFKNKKGFTLVELVVVIAILGILAGIAIPRFMDATATARGARIVADMRTIESAVSMNYAKTGSYTVKVNNTDTNLTLDNLVSAGYLASAIKPPVGSYIVSESEKTGTTTANSSYTIEQETAATTGANPTPASGAYVVKMDGTTLQTLLTK